MPDFRKNADRFAGFAAGKAKTIASFAAKKTKNVSRIAKLNVEIAAERDTIKRVYREIGKLYYETHRDDPDTYFAQLCQEINVSMESIAAMESEIARIKTHQAAPDTAPGEEPDTAPNTPAAEAETGEPPAEE